MSFEKKILVLETLNDYCLSKYVSVDDYIAEKRIDQLTGTTVKKYLGLMKSGSIDCTHTFYLKLYHILLASGSIKHNEFDLLMIDEAGDLNEVTLEIFKLLPSHKKVMVGDPYQNIFQFNKTINGFKEMENVGIHLPLSQSFRVSAPIANRIQKFCRTFMDPAMVFKGIDYTDEQLSGSKTSAFISRTNATLIGEMIKLNQIGKPYGLTRPAKSIFELPLGIITLSSKGWIKVPQYKFLEADYKDYHASQALQANGSFMAYLAEIYSDDISIKTAIALLMKHSPRTIIETHDAAKSHEGGNHSHTLCTSHSSKGLEFDTVYIAQDTTEKLKKIIQSDKFQQHGIDSLTPDEVGEMNLAYVAVSRSRFKLENADFLEWSADIEFDGDEDEFERSMHSNILDF